MLFITLNVIKIWFNLILIFLNIKKKEYSKLETPKSGSTNTKSSIKKKSGNKGEKKSNNENKSSINNNKDSATTTYFIFDDEEYLNE